MIMKSEEIQKHVEKFMALIPDHGISIARSAYRYFIQMDLDKEFINEVSKLMEPSAEKELQGYIYEWDLTKKK